jgi:ribosomal protein L37E
MMHALDVSETREQMLHAVNMRDILGPGDFGPTDDSEIGWECQECGHFSFEESESGDCEKCGGFTVRTRS